MMIGTKWFGLSSAVRISFVNSQPLIGSIAKSVMIRSKGMVRISLKGVGRIVRVEEFLHLKTTQDRLDDVDHVVVVIDHQHLQGAPAMRSIAIPLCRATQERLAAREELVRR